MTAIWEWIAPPSLTRSEKPTVGLPESIILMSTRAISRPKRNSKKSRKRTTSSATKKSGRFTISMDSTPTAFQPALTKLMREALWRTPEAVRVLISPASASLISLPRKSVRQGLVQLFAISSPRSSPAAAKARKPRQGRDAGETSSTTCTWASGMPYEGLRCELPSAEKKFAAPATAKEPREDQQ